MKAETTSKGSAVRLSDDSGGVNETSLLAGEFSVIAGSEEVDLESGMIPQNQVNDLKKKKTNANYHDDDGAEDNVSNSRLLRIAKPEWGWMSFAIGLLVIISLSNLLIPWMFGQLIDTISDTDSSVDSRRRELRTTVMQLFVVMIGSSILVIARGLIFNASGERVVARLRIDLFRAVMNQEIGFFDTRPTGELLSRLTSDTAKLQDAATTSISVFLRNFFTLILSLILLFVTSWKLALLCIVTVPLLVVVIVIYGRYIKKLSKRYTDKLALAADISSQSISSIRTCRSFAAEDLEVSKYSKFIGDPDDPLDKLYWWFAKTESTYQLGMYKALGHGLFLGFIMGLAQVTLVGLLWYGGELVLNGELSPGKLITFVMYSLNIAAALGSFANLFGQWMEAVGASTRTFEIIDRTPEPLKGGEKVDAAAQDIVFEDVTFSYPSREDIVVLDEFNLKIKGNTTVALVGQSGSGKSTVIGLLEKFYNPTAGKILIAGRDISTLDSSALRGGFGLVSQEPVLFALSIKENISYGFKASRPGVELSDEQIIEAAKMSNAHDFISSFPEGYDTVVGERGVTLSGGQKQRVAIARALLLDPKVLLLDEATSALDSNSEHLVQEAINRLMIGRTVIIVAHRLSTVRNADEIVVISKGKIKAKGTHDILMKTSEIYQDLVRKQLQQHDAQ